MIADDLTGAADCAASSAALGRGAFVLLHSPQDQRSDADWQNADIVSIDANCRCLSAERASRFITRLVHLCDSHNAGCPGYVLFKKIDSTLRGNVGSELVALLHARRSITPANAKLSILMCPALPAQGRTTVGGRLLVHGVPLEETDIWRTEPRTAQSNILRLLADAGLSCRSIDINTVRSGSIRLQQAIMQSAKQVDVVVCDAETDADLCAITKASLRAATITAFAGSAGLASQIGQAINFAGNTEPRGWRFAGGSTLFVVGSAASVSRQQARMLETIPEIVAFHATPAALHDSSMMHTQIMQSIQSGRDVLLVLDGDEHFSQYDEQFLPVLSHLVSRCAQFLGGLVATGGETARAVLDALGIHRLRLLGEVEVGLSFSVADGWIRPLPVITKAGAFGSPHALVQCRDFLQQLERTPVQPHAKHPFQ